jgi:hypothetical protein
MSLDFGVVVSRWRLCPKQFELIAQPDHPKCLRIAISNVIVGLLTSILAGKAYLRKHLVVLEKLSEKHPGIPLGSGASGKTSLTYRTVVATSTLRIPSKNYPRQGEGR